MQNFQITVPTINIFKQSFGWILGVFFLQAIFYLFLSAYFKSDADSSLLDRIQTKLTATQASLRNLIDAKKLLAKAVSKDVLVIRLVEGGIPTISVKDSNPHLKTSTFADFLNQHNFLDEGLTNYYITDLSRNAVAYRDDVNGELLHSLLEKEFLQAANNNVIVTLPKFKNMSLSRKNTSEKQVSVFVISPIYNNNKLLGFVVMEYDPESIMKPISMYGKIGNSGETYAVDRQGFLLSNSRFEPDLIRIGLMGPDINGSILRVKVVDPGSNLLTDNKTTMNLQDRPLTKSVSNVIKENNGYELKGYRDYRGVNVVGSWLWDESLDIGLITEIDYEDGYKSYQKLEQVLLITILVVFILISVVIYSINRSKLRLQIINNNLNEIVSESTAELLKKREEAEKANVAKSEFIANMSHELRTPMHSILSFSSLAMKRVKDEKTIRFLQNIRTSGIRLTNLLNDLLDLSKIESGNMELHPLEQDMTTLIEQSLAEVDSLLSDKEIAINLDTNYHVDCVIDQKLITQVIINLLSNAIKFSPSNSIVDISVTSFKSANDSELNDRVTVGVFDEGVGIPEAELKSVFDQFVQSSKNKKHSGGTGLGLAICKQIIELHSGKIWAQSPPAGRDNGTVVYFEIPTSLTPEHKHNLNNIDEAIASHKAWVEAIDQTFVFSTTNCGKTPSLIAADSRLCGLGQWIVKQSHNDNDMKELIKVHEEFHEIVGEYVTTSSCGQADITEKLKQDYLAQSGKIIDLLNQLKPSK